MDVREVLEHFYDTLAILEKRHGRREFRAMHGRLDWPERGAYFVFEPGERRADAPNQLRVTRVGAHGLKAGSRTTLWKRLYQHRGQTSGTGNHRGSVFRKHVGRALVAVGNLEALYPSWGVGSSAPRDVVKHERPMELHVSKVIGPMSVVWLPVDDEAGPDSQRGYVERNAIALLSTIGAEIDLASETWLGHGSETAAIRRSGLWNVDSVGSTVDEDFAEVFRRLARSA